MAHTSWETKLITKAINKTFCHKAKHPARRKSIKEELKSNPAIDTKKQ